MRLIESHGSTPTPGRRVRGREHTLRSVLVLIDGERYTLCSQGFMAVQDTLLEISTGRSPRGPAVPSGSGMRQRVINIITKRVGTWSCITAEEIRQGFQFPYGAGNSKGLTTHIRKGSPQAEFIPYQQLMTGGG